MAGNGKQESNRKRKLREKENKRVMKSEEGGNKKKRATKSDKGGNKNERETGSEKGGKRKTRK